MKEELKEELSKNAEEILNHSDKEIMALSLGKNENLASLK